VTFSSARICLSVCLSNAHCHELLHTTLPLAAAAAGTRWHL